MTQQSWGWEALFDLSGCDRAVVTEPEPLAAWVGDLVSVIQMTPYGEPQVFRFGEGLLTGLTVVQMITTSNVGAHFMDHNGDGYVNIFSCQPFVLANAIAQIERVLRPQTIHARLFSRCAGIGQRELAVWSTGRTPAAV